MPPHRPMAALPWGSGAALSGPTGGTTVSIKVLPFDRGGSSRGNFFASLLGRSETQLGTDSAGVWLAPPGSAFQVEVTVHESTPTTALRVIRGCVPDHQTSQTWQLCTDIDPMAVARPCRSIGGQEINEQLIVGTSRSPVRFVGWLESPDGTKRCKFTFPAEAGAEVLVQVAVLEATAIGGDDKASMAASPRPPRSHAGDSFAGPKVSNARFTLGAPLALGMARLRAQPTQSA